MNKTPKLRFKEFSGDWESKRLIDICDKVDKYSFTGGPFGSDLKSEHYTNEGVQIIQLQNIGDGEFINENKIYTSEEKADELISCNIYPGELIIAKMAEPVARACIIPNYRDRYLMASDGIRVVVDKDNYNTVFALNYINSNYFRKKAIINSTGATRLRIGLSELKNITLNLPSIKEQEKIASFLSLIDDKISLQGEKVEALKDYKKGMMQKIFSRELRFKDDDGRDYPEWEDKKLGDIGDTYTGLSGKTKENFGIGEAKYVIYKNVFGNTIAKENEIDLVEINESENQNKVIKGDLLFTTSSETPDEVGMISCWNYDIENLYLNSFCFGYRLFDLKQCSPVFIAYLLRGELYRRKISILGQGSTRYNISKTELMKMKVSVPVIGEQRKIENLLLGIESKLEKEQEKLASLKEYKKGLLQQMFV